MNQIEANMYQFFIQLSLANFTGHSDAHTFLENHRYALKGVSLFLMSFLARKALLCACKV